MFAPLFQESDLLIPFPSLFGPPTTCASAARIGHGSRYAVPRPAPAAPSALLRAAPTVAPQRGALRLLQRPAGYLLLAEVGEDVSKQDVKIDIEDHTMRLYAENAAQRKYLRDPWTGRVYVQELAPRRTVLDRSFALGADIDTSAISAALDGGVLTVRLPYMRLAAPAVRPARVQATQASSTPSSVAASPKIAAQQQPSVPGAGEGDDESMPELVSKEDQRPEPAVPAAAGHSAATHVHRVSKHGKHHRRHHRRAPRVTWESIEAAEAAAAAALAAPEDDDENEIPAAAKVAQPAGPKPADQPPSSQQQEPLQEPACSAGATAPASPTVDDHMEAFRKAAAKAARRGAVSPPATYCSSEDEEDGSVEDYPFDRDYLLE